GSLEWPPGIHGTGTEDFMNFSYEFPVRDTAYGLYHGVSLPGALHQNQWGSLSGKSNQWSVYRFHIQDPIPYRPRILVTCDPRHPPAGRSRGGPRAPPARGRGVVPRPVLSATRSASEPAADAARRRSPASLVSSRLPAVGLCVDQMVEQKGRPVWRRPDESQD